MSRQIAYTTTFCNKAHRLSDGKPVAHECYVLHPDILRDEASMGVESAIACMKERGLASMSTGIRHRGAKR